MDWNLRHGHAKKGAISPTYRSWIGMRQRCRNPKTAGFDQYGGRGIAVVAAWDSFDQFLMDMGERPPGTSLDRIDPDGHYEPKNCRWASQSVQNANRRAYSWSLASGVRHANAKLTPEEVRQARQLAASMSCTALSKRFGLSYPSMKALLEGRTYRRVV